MEANHTTSQNESEETTANHDHDAEKTTEKNSGDEISELLALESFALHPPTPWDKLYADLCQQTVQPAPKIGDEFLDESFKQLFGSLATMQVRHGFRFFQTLLLMFLQRDIREMVRQKRAHHAEDQLERAVLSNREPSEDRDHKGKDASPLSEDDSHNAPTSSISREDSSSSPKQSDISGAPPAKRTRMNIGWSWFFCAYHYPVQYVNIVYKWDF